MRMLRKPLLLLLPALLLLALLAPATAPAQGEVGPWFHLTSGALPTNIKPGVARNEVQEVKVSATEGEFFLVTQGRIIAFVGGIPFDDCANPSSTGCASGGPGTDLQSRLDTALGAEDVTVTGGPGDAAASKPYLVEFTAGLAYQAVPLMLTASPGVSISEVQKGSPDGQVVVTAANLGDAPIDGGETPVTIADTLPADLEAVGIEAFAGEHTNGAGSGGPVQCSLEGLTCTYQEGTLPAYQENRSRDLGRGQGLLLGRREPRERQRRRRAARAGLRSGHRV